jgi:ADP-ribose pyrophosphatase YjhB (NUDIX family)
MTFALIPSPTARNESSLYHRQPEPYFRSYPRSPIKVVSSDDLRSRPSATLREIFEYIGVDPNIEPDVSVDHDRSRVPRSRAVALILREDARAKAALGMVLPKGMRWRLFEIARGLNLRRPPELEVAHRRDLVEIFREDVEQLQTMLGRDLAEWLRA